MRLYIGNLSFDTTEDELRTSFTTVGTVVDIKIMRDHDSDRSRGFGFITMSNDAEGHAAIEAFHGKNLHGRNLIVNEARPREERAPNRNRGGDSRGGPRRFEKRSYNERRSS